MNTYMSQEDLQKVFDQVTRNVTKEVAGIQLHPGNAPPDGELCTVYTAFNKGFYSGLSFCAGINFFTRLTRFMLQTENVSLQYVEDFTKEYLNILCGHIASELYQITKVPSRFLVPTFHHEHYQPEGYQQQFEIDYFSKRSKGVQLIHYIPDQK